MWYDKSQPSWARSLPLYARRHLVTRQDGQWRPLRQRRPGGGLCRRKENGDAVRGGHESPVLCVPRDHLDIDVGDANADGAPEFAFIRPRSIAEVDAVNSPPDERSSVPFPADIPDRDIRCGGTQASRSAHPHRGPIPSCKSGSDHIGKPSAALILPGWVRQFITAFDSLGQRREVRMECISTVFKVHVPHRSDARTFESLRLCATLGNVLSGCRPGHKSCWAIVAGCATVHHRDSAWSLDVIDDSSHSAQRRVRTERRNNRRLFCFTGIPLRFADVGKSEFPHRVEDS